MKNLIQYGFLFVPILILFLIGCAKSIVTPIDLAHQFIENYEGYTSTSYDLNYQIKYFDQTGDTTKLTAKVDLIRENKDSIAGGYIWITADSVSTYYNTEALYSINHTINTIFKYPITNTSALTGNILHDTYNTYFLKRTRLISAINDTLVTATLTDETLSKSC